jgi:FdhD protein
MSHDSDQDNAQLLTEDTPLPPGAQPFTSVIVDKEGHTQPAPTGVIDEALVTIYVNGQELATIMCSPVDQEALAVGFCYDESVIDSMDEIALFQANVARTVVDVFLNRAEFSPPRRMILTSGCGGGITLTHLTEQHPALQSDHTTTPAAIFEGMRALQGSATLYQAVRGVHTAMLIAHDGTQISAEDVGRHNAVDKVAGKALMRGISTRDGLLLTSGRISSEMLGKARRMNIP